MSFFAKLRKANGHDYEPDSLHVMFSAIDRHVKSKSYPKSIREDNIFLPCCQVLEGKARKVNGKELISLDSLGNLTIEILKVVEKCKSCYNKECHGSWGPRHLTKKLSGWLGFDKSCKFAWGCPGGRDGNAGN